MAKKTGFERARAAFRKAGKSKEKIRTRYGQCAVPVWNDEAGQMQPCEARGDYQETFRGQSYHIVGQCSLGHKIERYGYSDGGDGEEVRGLDQWNERQAS